MQEETRKYNGRINLILCEKPSQVGSVQVHYIATTHRWALVVLELNTERGKASSKPCPRAVNWLE